MSVQKPTWIPVVTAMIRKGSKVLIGCRPKGRSLAGQWEFPGGKVEIGESPQEALTRELKEELGIQAQVGPARATGTQFYSEVGILLIFFEVWFWKGEPKPIHHSEIRWIFPEELKKLQIPEVNRRLLPSLLKILKDQRTS